VGWKLGGFTQTPRHEAQPRHPRFAKEAVKPPDEGSGLVLQENRRAWLALQRQYRALGPVLPLQRTRNAGDVRSGNFTPA